MDYSTPTGLTMGGHRARATTGFRPRGRSHALPPEIAPGNRLSSRGGAGARQPAWDGQKGVTGPRRRIPRSSRRAPTGTRSSPPGRIRRRALQPPKCEATPGRTRRRWPDTTSTAAMRGIPMKFPKRVVPHSSPGSRSSSRPGARTPARSSSKSPLVPGEDRQLAACFANRAERRRISNMSNRHTAHSTGPKTD
jgi:hypothetical protein